VDTLTDTSSAHTPDDVAQLVAAGRNREAIDSLLRQGEHEADPALERALVDLLLQTAPRPGAAGDIPQREAHRPPLVFREGAIPEVPADAFSVPLLREALDRSGHLIVRGFFKPEDVLPLRTCIDASLRSRVEAETNGSLDEDNPWYYPSPHFPGNHHAFHMLHPGRKHKLTGSIRVIDSPRGTRSVLQLYRSYAIKQLLEEYFEESAVLATRKWVFRLATPRRLGTGIGGGWHQDGQFMGADVRALNIWAPLSQCGHGTPAPGITLLPRRIDRLLESGTRGANLDWVVGGELVAELSREARVVNPFFDVGDALFFDHFSLHRSGYIRGQNADRYALESWFYAGSAVEENATVELP